MGAHKGPREYLVPDFLDSGFMDLVLLDACQFLDDGLPDLGDRDMGILDSAM